MAMATTTIPVSPEVRDRLRRLGGKGETYDAVLRRLLREVEENLLYERQKRILETTEFVPLDEV